MRAAIAAAAFAACMAVNAAAGESKGPGSASGEALRLARPADQLGAGEARTAAARGIGSLAANPAGLSVNEYPALHFTHLFHAADTAVEYIAYSQPILPGSGLGLGAAWMHNAGMPRTLETPEGMYAGEAGTYSSTFGAVSAGAGIDMRPIIGFDIVDPAAGVTVRLFGQQIDDERSLGGAADIGATLRVPGGLALGAVYQNAGGRFSGAPLPRQVTMGAAWEYSPAGANADLLLVELDASMTSDSGTVFRTGAEYRVMVDAWTLTFRGGWRQDRDVPDGSGISAGTGLHGPGKRMPWEIDYTYADFGVFGGLHALALTLGFVPAAVE